MKCIQNRYDLTGKEVRRVSDAEATRLVKSGTWRYVPKTLWKMATRPGYVFPRDRLGPLVREKHR